MLHTPLLKIRRPGGSPNHELPTIRNSKRWRSKRPLRRLRMATVPESGSAGGRRFPQYTRPFLPWDEIHKSCSGHLEVQRFLRLREGIRASAWYQRRSHDPCDVEVPPEWGLDALYFRQAGEEEYGRQLRELVENPENNLMGNHLICFPNPWVPYCWPAPQTACSVTYSNFPPDRGSSRSRGERRGVGQCVAPAGGLRL